MKQTIKLQTPVEFEGATVSELELDLDSLTGADLIAAERESNGPVSEMSKGYQAALAARAAGKPLELIHALKARDFTEVTVRVQGFLLGMDSEGESSES